MHRLLLNKFIFRGFTTGCQFVHINADTHPMTTILAIFHSSSEPGRCLMLDVSCNVATGRREE